MSSRPSHCPAASLSRTAWYEVVRHALGVSIELKAVGLQFLSNFYEGFRQKSAADFSECALRLESIRSAVSSAGTRNGTQIGAQRSSIARPNSLSQFLDCSLVQHALRLGQLSRIAELLCRSQHIGSLDLISPDFINKQCFQFSFELEASASVVHACVQSLCSVGLALGQGQDPPVSHRTQNGTISERQPPLTCCSGRL